MVSKRKVEKGFQFKKYVYNKYLNIYSVHNEKKL